MRNKSKRLAGVSRSPNRDSCFKRSVTVFLATCVSLTMVATGSKASPLPQPQRHESIVHDGDDINTRMAELWLKIEKGEIDAVLNACRSILDNLAGAGTEIVFAERAVLVTLGALLRAMESEASPESRLQRLVAADRLITRYLAIAEASQNEQAFWSSPVWAFERDVSTRLLGHARKSRFSKIELVAELSWAAPEHPTQAMEFQLRGGVLKLTQSSPSHADHGSAQARLGHALLWSGVGLLSASAGSWLGALGNLQAYKADADRVRRRGSYEIRHRWAIGMGIATAFAGVAVLTPGMIVLRRARRRQRIVLWEVVRLSIQPGHAPLTLRGRFSVGRARTAHRLQSRN